MDSSEPTPRQRLEGVRGEGLEGVVLRREQRRDLRGIWWLDWRLDIRNGKN